MYQAERVTTFPFQTFAFTSAKFLDSCQLYESLAILCNGKMSTLRRFAPLTRM